MNNETLRTIELADRIVSVADDALRGVQQFVTGWPPEFSAIMWEAVSELAAKRAKTARSLVTTQVMQPDLPTTPNAELPEPLDETSTKLD